MAAADATAPITETPQVRFTGVGPDIDAQRYHRAIARAGSKTLADVIMTDPELLLGRDGNVMPDVVATLQARDDDLRVPAKLKYEIPVYLTEGASAGSFLRRTVVLGRTAMVSHTAVFGAGCDLIGHRNIRFTFKPWGGMPAQELNVESSPGALIALFEMASEEQWPSVTIIVDSRMPLTSLAPLTRPVDWVAGRVWLSKRAKMLSRQARRPPRAQKTREAGPWTGPRRQRRGSVEREAEDDERARVQVKLDKLEADGDHEGWLALRTTRVGIRVDPKLFEEMRGENKKYEDAYTAAMFKTPME